MSANCIMIKKKYQSKGKRKLHYPIENVRREFHSPKKKKKQRRRSEISRATNILSNGMEKTRPYYIYHVNHQKLHLQNCYI
jgi:hypothetical protein